MNIVRLTKKTWINLDNVTAISFPTALTVSVRYVGSDIPIEYYRSNEDQTLTKEVFIARLTGDLK